MSTKRIMRNIVTLAKKERKNTSNHLTSLQMSSIIEAPNKTVRTFATPVKKFIIVDKACGLPHKRDLKFKKILLLHTSKQQDHVDHQCHL